MALEYKPSREEIIKMIINGTPSDFELRSSDSEFAAVQLSNFCANDCLYCKYSRDNWTVERKRKSKEEVMEALKEAGAGEKKKLLLYSGLDLYFFTDRLTDIIREVRKTYPDSELYLALNERVYEDYEEFYKAGANGFILPHRSINEEHFSRIHPMDMYPDFRKNVLPILREIGLKIGTGITVGWPYQTAEMICEDIEFVSGLKPDLIVVDRFVPAKDTQFEGFDKGSIKQTENVMKIAGKILPEADILTRLELD
ncbi:MAG: radical SAM protein [Bacillota bacterium]|nr:radical SAM protein [Bacillota bacterium]